jgi:TPR repeat protein
MKTPWYQKWFSGNPVPDLSAIKAKAEQGDADAQFSLGLSSGFVVGGETKDAEAAGWYRLAADQGHALAQFNLANMYASGQGVTLDDAEAARWYLRSADLGDAGAQFQMGKRCHRRGMDASKTDAGNARIEAYKWFNLASVQGYRGSEAQLEQVNLMLTREEFDEGQRRAASFVVQARED